MVSFPIFFFTGLPGVLFVLPDSYVDAENKDYGGMPRRHLSAILSCFIVPILSAIMVCIPQPHLYILDSWLVDP